MARNGQGLMRSVVCLGVVGALLVLTVVDNSAPAAPPSAGHGPGEVIRAAQKKPARKKGRGKRPSSKNEAADAGDATPAADAATAAPAPADGALKFSRDIAPIFVNNCTSCHNEKPASKRIKLDLTTFEKIMAGTPDHKVVVPGNLEESHLVMRIKGEERPKMPQGANRALSAAAVEKVSAWVKAGAVLDKGIDPKAQLSSYAASPEDLRKAELAKLPHDERDKQTEAAGLARWKKASPKTTPEVASSTHFLLFSTQPKERAGVTVKAVESQFGAVRGLLGASAVDWGEKASLFVFHDAASFAEFVRGNENRDVERGDTGTARFNIPQPYVAVLEPAGGRSGESSAPEKASPAPRKGRSRRGDDEASVGGDRTLPGVLTEQLFLGAAGKSGKYPRWVTLGSAAVVASRVDRGSGYYQKIRRDAYQLWEQGWVPKANEALGGEAKAEDVRAVGFAIMEWLAASGRNIPAAFVSGMRDGGEKLDEVIGKVLNGSRSEFLAGAGEFVQEHYGR